MLKRVHQYVEGLVKSGELTPEEVASAVSTQGALGLPFAEILVLRGRLTESQLLAAVTAESGVRTVTSDKIGQLRVDPDVLDRVPVRTAEKLCALPIRYDASEKTVQVLVPTLEPSVLDRVKEAAAGLEVTFLVGTTFAIRAGIKRHYYADAEAFRALATLAFAVTHGSDKCNSCGMELPPRALQCPKCGLLSDLPMEAAEVSNEEPSVVRALISRPEATALKRIVAEPGEEPAPQARVDAGPLDPALVPTLLAGIDVALMPLDEYEADVVHRIDGRVSVGQLLSATRLPRAEATAILHALAGRKVIAFGRPAIPMTPPRGVPVVPPPPTPETAHVSVLQHALALERAGKLDECIAVLDGGIAALKSAALYNKLAAILFRTRRDAKRAVRLLIKAADLEPENQVYLDNLYTVLAWLRLHSGTRASANPGS